MESHEDAAPGVGHPAAMIDLAPVETRLEVRPEWTDANGHMNVAYYVLAFDRATDAFYDRLDLGWSSLTQGRSLFTLAMNVDYLNEIFAGETVRITSRLLDCDAKRLHYLHEMARERDGALAATNEIVALNVGMAARKSEPFPAEIAARLAAMKAAHAALPLPPQAGRTLGLKRPPEKNGANSRSTG
jgi:acyl-CoA thioester hydrolase